MRLDIIQPPRTLLRLDPAGSLPLALLESSIKRHGVLTPLVICDGVIVDGYRRWLACRALGHTEVPTHSVEGDPAQLRLVAQSQTQSLSKADRVEVVGNILRAQPHLTRTQLAYELQWPLHDIDDFVGATSLIDDWQARYRSGALRPATCWLVSRLDEQAQYETLDCDPDYVHELAAAAYRSQRSMRRARIVGKQRPRAYRTVERELQNPTIMGTELIRSKAKTPADGWTAALKWVMRVD